MRSLRARLMLGIAVIAVLPVSVITFTLSKRIETLVRAQATERLDLALTGLQERLVAEGRDIETKIYSLSADPTLRRLYLVGSSSRDLSDFLDERRRLLSLDFLIVADSTGTAINEPAPSALTLARGSPIAYEGRVVGELLGGLVFDRGFLLRLKRSSGVDLMLADLAGQPLASTFPDSALRPPSSETVVRVMMSGRPYLARAVPLDLGAAEPTPQIVGLISTESADRTISGLELTSALLALLGLALAVLLGVLWSSQISKPVEELADFSRKVAGGEWDEPLKLHSVKELETLVTALDRMRQDLKTYRERLVTSERHAAWSQMARKVAHEVKNPLTPIAISVEDLKRSYEQKRPEFPAILDQAVKTIGEEVERLKRMLQEFSEFGRLPAPQFESCRLGDLFTDLNALYTKDVQAKTLLLEIHDPETTFTADRSQIRQALVNLLQNGFEAVNGHGCVVVKAQAEPNDVRISVSDNGPGLTPEQSALLFSPGFTTKKTGSGLGLVMVERIVSDHHGTIHVDSQPGEQTTFTLRIPRVRQT